jgi:calcineurin-like phosphoesterase
VIRPINYPRLSDAPGRGAYLFEAPGDRRVLVINALGRVHMDALDDPFAAVDAQLEAVPWERWPTPSSSTSTARPPARSQPWATSATAAPAWWSAPTPTFPTADTQILNGGTAYQTDAGACCDYDSVIGMEKSEPLRRFTTRINGGRFQPAAGPATVCGVYVETDPRTGLALRAEPIRIGGRLSQHVPEPAAEFALA